MITFVMFIINSMTLVTLFLIAMTLETYVAIPNMVIVFTIVMVLNYLVMHLDEL